MFLKCLPYSLPAALLQLTSLFPVLPLLSPRLHARINSFCSCLPRPPVSSFSNVVLYVGESNADRVITLQSEVKCQMSGCQMQESIVKQMIRPLGVSMDREIL